jgi:hypothetical protein
MRIAHEFDSATDDTADDTADRAPAIRALRVLVVDDP